MLFILNPDKILRQVLCPKPIDAKLRFVNTYPFKTETFKHSIPTYAAYRNGQVLKWL
jgi:hypothetical protein